MAANEEIQFNAYFAKIKKTFGEEKTEKKILSKKQVRNLLLFNL